jgi:DNA-binding response OmpR family regulator
MAPTVAGWKHTERARTFHSEHGQADATTLLLIEGDPVVRETYRRLLTRAGYRVRLASDGVAALKEVLANPPDLLFLEVRLPGLEGQIALEQVRSHAAGRSLPVVIYSKWGEAELVKRGLRPDASQYLVTNLPTAGSARKAGRPS